MCNQYQGCDTNNTIILESNLSAWRYGLCCGQEVPCLGVFLRETHVCVQGEVNVCVDVEHSLLVTQRK